VLCENLFGYYVNAPKSDLPDGPLYAMRPNHVGWILFIIVPGALLAALLIHGFGIRQSHAVLEQVSIGNGILPPDADLSAGNHLTDYHR